MGPEEWKSWRKEAFSHLAAEPKASRVRKIKNAIVDGLHGKLDARIRALFTLHAAMLPGVLDSGDKGARATLAANLGFQQLVKTERRLKPFWREFQVSAGNFCARWGRADEAFDLFREASHRDPDDGRRALAQFNIAKLHLTTGNPHAALSTLCEIKHAPSRDARLGISIRLAECRCHLIFGYSDRANEILAVFRGEMPDHPLRAEFLYISLIARSTLQGKPAFARRVEDFLQATKALASDSSALYEFEGTLLLFAASPRAIKNRERAMMRMSFLAKQLGMKRLGSFGRLIEACLRRSDSSPRQQRDLLNATDELLRSDHVLTVRTVAAWTTLQLIERRRFDLARRLLELLEINAGSLLGPVYTRRSVPVDENKLLAELTWLAQKLGKRRTAPSGYAWLFDRKS